MKIIKVPFSEKGYYRIITAPDIEFVDPIDYYSNAFIESKVSLERDMLLLKKFPFPIHHVDHLLIKRALAEWREKYQEIITTEIPENFISLLTADSKRDQLKLLRGQNLTPSQLIGLIFRAWTYFGYSFSQYSARHHHNGLNKAQLPTVIEIQDDETITKVGPATLTDGQLRNVVEHRKVIISKFLDNKTNWHCFFLTFKSIRREESWQDGQSHFHYISDKFGVSRENVVTQLKSKDYNLGTLPHIGLLDYGDNK